MKYLLILGFVLFPIFFANGEVLNYTTYSDYTEIPKTIAWDPSENAEYYKFQAYHYEQNSIAVIGTTAQTQIIIHFPRSGHYIIKVKACAVQQEIEVCSEFSESTNSEFATVNGQPKAWWIFKHVSPPGPIGIE